MEQAIKSVLSEIKTPGTIDIGRSILLTMRAVEEYSHSADGLSGVEKGNLALQYTDVLLEEAMVQGLIDPQRAFAIQEQLGAVDVKSVVDTLVAVSKHPQFIQIRDEVVSTCCPSLGKRLKHANGSRSQPRGAKRRARSP